MKEITIKIQDEILEDFTREANFPVVGRGLEIEIENLMYDYLRRHCRPGYDVDNLTGFKTYHYLELSLPNLIWNGDETTSYKDTFLCVDIEHLRKYVEFGEIQLPSQEEMQKLSLLDVEKELTRRFQVQDERANAKANQTVKDVAEALEKAYPGAEFFRFDNDEFIVRLGDRPFAPVEGLEVKLRYAFVKTDCKREMDMANGANSQYGAGYYQIKSLLLLFAKAMRIATSDLDKIPTLEFIYPETD